MTQLHMHDDNFINQSIYVKIYSIRMNRLGVFVGEVQSWKLKKKLLIYKFEFSYSVYPSLKDKWAGISNSYFLLFGWKRDQPI